MFSMSNLSCVISFRVRLQLSDISTLFGDIPSLAFVGIRVDFTKHGYIAISQI